MQTLKLFSKTIQVLFAVIAPLSLTGTECSFVARSGTHSSDDKDQRSNLVVVISDGRLVDAPVQGVRYVSGAVSGITGANGEFQYEAGNSVGFFLGDIALGEPVAGKAIVTPLDLVPGGTLDTPAVINIARLLQSLDSVPGDGRISIPATMRTAAVQSNEALASSIQFLDFTDETAFVNTASQLVAVLTASYPFSAVLVDAQTARGHLIESLADAGLPQ